MKAQDYKISSEKFVFRSQGDRLHDKKLETKPVSYFKDALNRFAKNKASIAATVIIGILIDEYAVSLNTIFNMMLMVHF